MPVVFSFAPFGANIIFLAFVVLFAVGLIYGYYTIGGSAINNHPHNGRGGAPGANRPDAIHAFATQAQDQRELARETREWAREQRDAERTTTTVMPPPELAPAPAQARAGTRA